MDTQALGAPTARPAAMDGRPRDAVPEPGLGGGWLVSRDCPLGGGGLRVDLVLLHPGIGVALVDFAPKDTDAVGRFRTALDGRRFPAIFGGYPPVIRAILPADRLSDLGRVLAEEFKAQPPLSLAGGDSWVRSARSAAEAEAPVRAPERPLSRRPGAFPWRAAALAVAAGGLVGSFVAVLVPPPGRGPATPLGPAASPTASAPAIGIDALSTAEFEDDDLTAPDVRAALASADPAAVGAGAEEAARELQEARNAAPVLPEGAAGAPPEGAEVAREPRESRSAASAVAAGEGRPDTQPEGAEVARKPQEARDAAPAAVAGGERPDAPPEPVRAAAPLTPDPRSSPDAEPSPDAPVAAAAAPPLPTAAATPGPERRPAAMAATGGASPEPPAPPPAPARGPAPRPPHAPPGKAYPDGPSEAAAPHPPAPKRPAAPAGTPPKPATETAAASGRRTASPATPAGPGGGGRCGAILARAMVGGPLSEDDRDYLRRGCDRRG